MGVWQGKWQGAQTKTKRKKKGIIVYQCKGVNS